MGSASHEVPTSGPRRRVERRSPIGVVVLSPCLSFRVARVCPASISSPPPTEQSRSQMRSVQLDRRALGHEDRVLWTADGALEGAWRGARAGFLTTLLSVRPWVRAVSMRPGGPRCRGPGSRRLLGASIGAGKAELAAKVKETETVIREVLGEWNVRERFRDRIASALRERAPMSSSPLRTPNPRRRS
jgi:hypothetical protein